MNIRIQATETKDSFKEALALCDKLEEMGMEFTATMVYEAPKDHNPSIQETRETILSRDEMVQLMEEQEGNDEENPKESNPA